MEIIKTRQHEIRTTANSGLTPLYTSSVVTLVQCKAAVSPGFPYLSDFTKGYRNPWDAFDDYESFAVEMPFGREGGLILGNKIGKVKKAFSKPSDFTMIACIKKMECVSIWATLGKLREKGEDVGPNKSFFDYAIEFISKVNVCLSGEGYMVALMNKEGKVIEVIDHLSDEECAHQAQKFLYSAALMIETPGKEITFSDVGGV